MPERSRAISLSLDWDNIVKEEDEEAAGATIGGKFYMQQAIEYDRQTTEFCTGSSYAGKWNALGMANSGVYRLPYGVEYEGGMDDGMFHGVGTLTFPMGQKLEGVWEKGKMLSYKFHNMDGLEMDEPWNYCKMPERRFTVSLREGLQAAPNEFKTNQQPTREIDPGCYDTGDGYYNPKTKIVVRVRDEADYENIDEAVASKYAAEDDFWINYVSIVSDERDAWIRKHCRAAWDQPAGYRPDFYEFWVTGRQRELKEIDEAMALSPTQSTDSNFVSKNDIFNVEEQLRDLDLESTSSATRYLGGVS